MTSTRWKPSWTTKSPTENQDTWSSGRGGLMTTISGCGKATWCTRPRCSKSSSKGKRQKANGTRSKIDHVSCQKAAQKTKTPKPPTHPTLNAHNLNAKTLNAKTHMLPNQNPRSVVLLVCHEGRQPILCILSGAPKEGRKTIAYLKTSHIHEILQRLRDLVQHDAGKEGGRNRTNPLGSREEPRMTEGIGEKSAGGTPTESRRPVVGDIVAGRQKVGQQAAKGGGDRGNTESIEVRTAEASCRSCGSRRADETAKHESTRAHRQRQKDIWLRMLALSAMHATRAEIRRGSNGTAGQNQHC
ncbi:hypothetical protein N7G274_010774 [Stereocaulon virgatum]|uniref:Uncharacterized protein n=1 Tax=Stereocaulon virgatum TaxID=373712 RepID=A0ABR3ZSX4_9LECA